jgi:hypothetical protein
MSMEGIRAFLEGSEEIGFAASKQVGLYAWAEKILVEQGYGGVSLVSDLSA